MHLFVRRRPAKTAPIAIATHVTFPLSEHEPSQILIPEIEYPSWILDSDDVSLPITLEWEESDGEFAGDDGVLVHFHGYSLVRDGRYCTQADWPSFYSLNVFAFKIAGITHHQKDANSQAFRAGELTILERDPSNPYGSNAVKMLSADRSHFAGYVPQELSSRIAPLMDELGHNREPGMVLKTYNVGQHRHGIEIVSAVGRELSLSDD